MTKKVKKEKKEKMRGKKGGGGVHMFIEIPFPFLAYKHDVIFLFSVPECYILTCTNNHQNPDSIVNYTAAQICIF